MHSSTARDDVASLSSPSSATCGPGMCACDAEKSAKFAGCAAHFELQCSASSEFQPFGNRPGMPWDNATAEGRGNGRVEECGRLEAMLECVPRCVCEDIAALDYLASIVEWYNFNLNCQIDAVDSVCVERREERASVKLKGSIIVLCTLALTGSFFANVRLLGIFSDPMAGESELTLAALDNTIRFLWNWSFVLLFFGALMLLEAQATSSLDSLLRVFPGVLSIAAALLSITAIYAAQHRALPWHLKLTWRHYMEALLLVVCAVTLAGVVVSFVSTFQFFREEAPGVPARAGLEESANALADAHEAYSALDAEQSGDQAHQCHTIVARK